MGKTLVITGATRGLGLAMARRFAAQGHVVHACGRNPDLVASLAAELPAPSTARLVDIADDRSVSAWARAIAGPAPDLLLNNAAAIPRNAPLWHLAPDETDPVVDINIKGSINTIRHFLPAMIARGSGVIVNFSSGWGRTTSPEVATYCATKFAIEGLTAALAQELPPGLAAVALNPGIIHTDMLESCFGPAASTHQSTSQWIDKAAPFLLSLGPSHNGASLSVP
jgi:NAD(P)-dependent dehydrogenase (short-subunit alcohol dehydrogenase family)